MPQNSTSLSGRDGTSITVTDVSASTLIAESQYEVFCADVLVQNIGTEPCWLRTGDASVSATQLSVMMPALWRETFEKGTATHIAAVCAAGKTTTIVVTPLSQG